MLMIPVFVDFARGLCFLFPPRNDELIVVCETKYEIECEKRNELNSN